MDLFPHGIIYSYRVKSNKGINSSNQPHWTALKKKTEMCSNEIISPPAFSCPAAHFEIRSYPYESKQLKNKILRTLQYLVFINNLTLICV